MALVLGITSFLLALGAIYLAAEAQRRARAQSETFVKDHITGLRTIIHDLQRIVDGVDGRLHKLEHGIGAVQSMEAKNDEAIATLRRDVAQAQGVLAEVAKLLPSRQRDQHRRVA